MFGFKALIDAWRGKGLVPEMFDEFQDMLKNSAMMLKVASDALAGNVEQDKARAEMRARDKQINRIQRGIRRGVVEHMVYNPGVDVAASLVLMSIVKDAERLGDYARALYEAGDISAGVVSTPGYAEAIKDIEDGIEGLIYDAAKALQDSDEALARDVMAREDSLKAKCDDILARVAADRLPGDKTAALAVISRYLRRMTAHTANIASSVTNPVEWLDYKPKEGK